MLKTCRRCGKERDATAFPVNRRTRDRRSSWCRDCHAEAARASRRRAKVDAILAEAVDYERKADEVGGLAADFWRQSAERLRREAARGW